jgi:TRAP transporter 4TM/12TM fusion protein
MSEAHSPTPRSGGLAYRIVYAMSVILVIVGVVNSMPSIPGWDAMIKGLLGNDQLPVRRFPPEYFYPVVFAWMMVIVALQHSMWRDWQHKSPLRRRFGLFMDVALVIAAFAISLSYVIEISSVCLIDALNGDRARLMETALKDSIAFAKEYGLPVPDTVDDPKCMNTTGVWLALIMGISMLVFLGYNIKVWGFPLVAVSLGIAIYTIGTVFVWYFFGSDDINKYLVTKLGSEPRTFLDGIPNVQDALINNSSGILGKFIHITLNVVFPYIVLGALFGKSAGGQALIKIAFIFTRRLRGGPAHAAVVSSALFGTITGGPVVNVLSTGVLTIPMMIKRGFSKTFAGGIEAAASSGGSIMPPVMGVAAFVLAALTSVPYRDVIIAAAIPAVAYFFCLFLAVVFQARKQNIQAIGDNLPPEMRLTKADRLHLMQILLPILLILILLLTPKDSVGCGWIGQLLGAVTEINNGKCRAIEMPWLLETIQNAAGDASAAGWWSALLVAVLLFLDKEWRKKPGRFLDALSDTGETISTLFLMFLAVTVIDVCLTFTGLSKYVAFDTLEFLLSLDLGGSGSILFQFIALFVTMVLAIILGMGMPAVPAYINVALLMGPLLIGLGISTFTAHMFIFYYAVASAITPPVAMAAFAASTITKADPMATGFSAVKSGIVMFVIPYVFAFYPELLLIDSAVKDPASPTGAYLAGYDGGIHIGLITEVLARLVVALYLLASALSRFDFKRLPRWEVFARLGLALVIMHHDPMVFIPATILGLAWIGWGVVVSRRETAAAA